MKQIVVLTDEPPLYRDLMRFKPTELTPNGWAVRAGVSRTVWSDMRRHGNPSRRTLEKLLSAAGSSLAEFEALRVGDRASMEPNQGSRLGDALLSSWRPAPLPPLPVLTCSAAGEWKPGSGVAQVAVHRLQILDHIERPRSLAHDNQAYALTMIGDEMSPRFRPGRRIIVSPGAPVEIGDDVVVILSGGNPAGALIKQLTRRSDSLVELTQHNPHIRFMVDATATAALHKVMGEAI